MPEIATLCRKCGRIAHHVCSMCGGHFCDEHFDSKLGLCLSCARGRKTATAQKKRKP